jgi:hypothetical protein
MHSLCSRIDSITVPDLTAVGPRFPYRRANPGGPGEPHESEEERMDTTRIEASVDTHAAAFDTLARSLRVQLPRRRVASLLAAALATGVFGFSRRSSAEAAAATSIPPNCIYVCCDGTCDSWKMCLRCVTWPKATTTATIASQ